jgi:hypothetical protein
MKKFLPSFVLSLLCVTISFAQAPKGINYQGVARDNEGNPYASKTISVRIGILKNSASGEVEYSETHKPQTNQFGLFTLVIGQGTAVTGDFAFISWAIGNKWLQIDLDPNGGSSFTPAGSQQLMTVPYAFYAEYAGNSSGLAAGTGIAIDEGVINNTGDADGDPTNELQNLAEVLTKSNNAGGIKITNLGAPVVATDAATKNYVDAQNALDLDKSNTNEIQDLTLNTATNILNITNNTGATPINLTPYKQTLTYTPATNNLAISGGNAVTISTTLSQAITNGGATGANGNRIQNLGTPTSPNDATTKSYVDNALARTYAFKTNFSFTNTSGVAVNDQEMVFTVEDFDSFNVLATNAFTATENGTYVFMIDGVYNAAISGGQISLLYNSVKRSIPIILPFGSTVPRYNATFMFQLTAGQTVKIIGDNVLSGASFAGYFYGYKL